MLISKKLNDAINGEVGLEFFAQFQYLQFAAYCENLALEEMAKFYKKQAEDEKAHALKFIDYVVETGGSLMIPDVESPRATFTSIDELAQTALDWEWKVTRNINRLMDIAVEERDYLAQDFLRWFVTEQLEELSTMDRIQKIVKNVGEKHLFMLEAYFSHR